MDTGQGTPLKTEGFKTQAPIASEMKADGVKIEEMKSGGINSFGFSALGIIETRGRSSLIEALDAAIKAAPVEMVASYFVGGGCNTVTLTGDVGALRAALDEAQKLMDRSGVEGKTHLIPRLAREVWAMIAPSPQPVPVRKEKGRTERRHGTK